MPDRRTATHDRRSASQGDVTPQGDVVLHEDAGLHEGTELHEGTAPNEDATLYEKAVPHDAVPTVRHDASPPARHDASPTVLATASPAITLPVRPRILLAEDVDCTRRMVDFALRDQPFDTVIAADGDEALALYRAARHSGHPFCLLVLDVVMPHLSGLGVAEQVRAEGDSQTPIVLWTAEDSPLVDMRASSAHIQEIWQKANEPEALANSIKRMLRM